MIAVQLDQITHIAGDMSEIKDQFSAMKVSIEGAQSESAADARRTRRQRNRDQVEILEDQLFITQDLLGKGGFGAVYLADYNGRNTAAKVWERTCIS